MVSISNFTRYFTNGEKYIINFTDADNFDFLRMSSRINLDALIGAPIYTKALVKCLTGVRWAEDLRNRTRPPPVAFLHSLTTGPWAIPGVARSGGMNKQLLQHRTVGLTRAKPVFQKRRRLALAVERQDHRLNSSSTSGPSRSDRSARAAAL